MIDKNIGVMQVPSKLVLVDFSALRMLEIYSVESGISQDKLGRIIDFEFKKKPKRLRIYVNFLGPHSSHYSRVESFLTLSISNFDEFV